MARIVGILTGVTALGMCVFAGTLQSEAASQRMAVLGAVVGMLGFITIFLSEAKRRHLR